MGGRKKSLVTLNWLLSLNGLLYYFDVLCNFACDLVCEKSYLLHLNSIIPTFGTGADLAAGDAFLKAMTWSSALLALAVILCRSDSTSRISFLRVCTLVSSWRFSSLSWSTSLWVGPPIGLPKELSKLFISEFVSVA